MINLKSAVSNIPLYQSLYGNNIKNIDIDNLSTYPMLQRKDIIENFPNNWLSVNSNDKLEEGLIEFATTSGSSGQRIKIIRKAKWWQDEYQRTYPFIEGLEGFNVGKDKKAILTTATCSNTSCYLDSPTYEQRLIDNTLYLNFHMDPNSWSDADVRRIIQELNLFKPSYLDADPVYLALLIKKAKTLNLLTTMHRPKVLTLSYELVTGFLRKFIEAEFHQNPTNLYGTTELGYLYAENNFVLDRCHLQSHIEFEPFNANKGIYHLVVTSLKNEFMPFVRFKIGDLVKIDLDKIKKLDNLSQIEFLCGREKDILFDKHNEPITLGEIDNAIMNLSENVLIYQLQIISKDLIQFCYISKDNFILTYAESSSIRLEIQRLLGISKTISFKLERSISVSTTGKFEIIKKYGLEVRL